MTTRSHSPRATARTDPARTRTTADDEAARKGLAYKATRTPALVVPEPQWAAMIDGAGDPNTSNDYSDCVATLYAVSYGARAAAKKAGGTVHPVGPLEGLWWADDPRAFVENDRSAWRWTMLIAQPDDLPQALLDDALAAAASRGKAPAADRLRWDRLDEGEAMQVLHLGPYAAEGPTIAALHAAIAEQGLTLRGPHHEIYLGDPRRSAPEKLRTILRQPVTRP